MLHPRRPPFSPTPYFFFSILPPKNLAKITQTKREREGPPSTSPFLHLQEK